MMFIPMWTIVGADVAWRTRMQLPIGTLTKEVANAATAPAHGDGYKEL